MQSLRNEPKMKRSHERIAVCFNNTIFTYVMLSITAIAFGAIFMASGKTTNHLLWGSIAVVCFSAFCVALTTRTVIAGQYGGVRTFYVVQKSDSPFAFWTAVVFGYAIAVAMLIGVLLFNLGILK